MKLLTYREKGQKKECLGVLQCHKQSVIPVSELGINYETMNELIQKADEEELKSLKEAASSEKEFSKKLEDIEILAPIPVPMQDIICLGVNYKAHAEESARYKKEEFDLKAEYPVYFSKRVNEAVGHLHGIPVHKDMVDSLDYEVELALIIGKDAKDVAACRAYEYIFGYTILNDMSARNIQTRHKQWYFGKSLNGFTPMGPWLVTEDEFQRPPSLHIRSRVNGEVRQDSSTDLLIFDIPYVIEELSKGMTLKAGTIISMGTPAGVGMGFVPPRFLKAGDLVECEIENIGVLSNKIAAER